MNQEPTLKPVGHGGGRGWNVPYRFGRYKINGQTWGDAEPKSWSVFVADYSGGQRLGRFDTLDEALEFARVLWRADKGV
jgi:hypothetical protein